MSVVKIIAVLALEQNETFFKGLNRIFSFFKVELTGDK